MCEECKTQQRRTPPLSLLLWFAGITSLMVAIARWA